MRPTSFTRYRAHRRPTERRCVTVIANRVVEFETRHVSDTLWIANGKVSEPLPSGVNLRRPTTVIGTGVTEADAIADLRRAVERLGNSLARAESPPLAS